MVVNDRVESGAFCGVKRDDTPRRFIAGERRHRTYRDGKTMPIRHKHKDVFVINITVTLFDGIPGLRYTDDTLRQWDWSHGRVDDGRHRSNSN